MGFFFIFKIVQMAPKPPKRLKWSKKNEKKSSLLPPKKGD